MLAQKPELMRKQWRREGSISGAEIFQNGGLILSAEVLPQLGPTAVFVQRDVRVLTLSSRTLKKIMAFISLVNLV